MQAQSEGAGFSQKSMLRTWLMPLVAMAIVAFFAIVQLGNWPERLRFPGKQDAAEGTIDGPVCYLLGEAIIGSMLHLSAEIRSGTVGTS